MKSYIFILVLIIGVPNNLLSQNRSIIKASQLVRYSLNELQVKDSLLIKGIDSIIMRVNCPMIKHNSKDNFFFYIDQNEQYGDSLFMNLALSKEPDGRRCLGYFSYKNNIFMVYGKKAVIFFSKKSSRKQFSFVERNPQPTFDPPEWDMLYSNNKIMLLKFYP